MSLDSTHCTFRYEFSIISTTLKLYYFVITDQITNKLTIKIPSNWIMGRAKNWVKIFCGIRNAEFVKV